MAKKKQKKVHLNKKQIQFLRGQAHILNPFVMVGQNGVTSTVIDEVDTALDHNELIKVKLQATATVDRNEVSDELVQQTNAGLVQVIGKVIILYRPSLEMDKDKKIHLPK